MTWYLGGADEEKLVRGISRAVDEHGAPNTFYPRELWIDYGAPHQLIIGSLLRSERIRADVAKHLGRSVEYLPPSGAGHRDGCRVVIGEINA